MSTKVLIKVGKECYKCPHIVVGEYDEIGESEISRDWCRIFQRSTPYDDKSIVCIKHLIPKEEMELFYTMDPNGETDYEIILLDYIEDPSFSPKNLNRGMGWEELEKLDISNKESSE